MDSASLKRCRAYDMFKVANLLTYRHNLFMRLSRLLQNNSWKYLEWARSIEKDQDVLVLRMAKKWVFEENRSKIKPPECVKRETGAFDTWSFDSCGFRDHVSNLGMKVWRKDVYKTPKVETIKLPCISNASWPRYSSLSSLKFYGDSICSVVFPDLGVACQLK